MNRKTSIDRKIKEIKIKWTEIKKHMNIIMKMVPIIGEMKEAFDFYKDKEEEEVRDYDEIVNPCSASTDVTDDCEVGALLLLAGKQNENNLTAYTQKLLILSLTF